LRGLEHVEEVAVGLLGDLVEDDKRGVEPVLGVEHGGVAHLHVTDVLFGGVFGRHWLCVERG
jgi:hypothetical protein